MIVLWLSRCSQKDHPEKFLKEPSHHIWRMYDWREWISQEKSEFGLRRNQWDFLSSSKMNTFTWTLSRFRKAHCGFNVTKSRQLETLQRTLRWDSEVNSDSFWSALQFQQKKVNCICYYSWVCIHSQLLPVSSFWHVITQNSAEKWGRLVSVLRLDRTLEKSLCRNFERRWNGSQTIVLNV